MSFELAFTPEAYERLTKLESDHHSTKRLKAIRKVLAYLANNPKHPSLNSHKHESFSKNIKQEGFEAYAENNCPGAYRIFWHYGSEKNMITIVSIVQHP